MGRVEEFWWTSPPYGLKMKEAFKPGRFLVVLHFICSFDLFACLGRGLLLLAKNNIFGGVPLLTNLSAC
jgi:hypothetical protein